MKIKRFVPIGAFLLSLASCAASHRDFDILIYDDTDTFMSAFAQDIRNGMSGYGYSYSSFGAARSQATQNKQIVSALESGSKLLIVNLVDRLAASAIIEKTKKWNGKLIFINREPLTGDLEGNEDCAFYVGSNSEQAGVLQGELAEQLFIKQQLDNKLCPYDTNKDGIINVAIIRGEEGHQDTEERTKWCTQKMVDDGYQINILTTASGNWTKDGGYDAMKKIYSDYYGKEDPSQNVELLFSNNDDMAKGATDYLLEHGVLKTETTYDQQPIQIIGFDGTSVGMSLVNDGLIYGTVLNDAKTQSDHVCALAKRILQGLSLEDVEQVDNVDGKIITKNT